MITNIGFNLVHDYCVDSDIRCPKCKMGYNVEWDTEYGEPMFGEHEATCPECDHVWKFEVYIEYSQ